MYELYIAYTQADVSAMQLYVAWENKAQLIQAANRLQDNGIIVYYEIRERKTNE